LSKIIVATSSSEVLAHNLLTTSPKCTFTGNARCWDC